MAAEPTTDTSLPALAAELWDLVRGYVKQETTEPLKGLGRYARNGLLGSVLLSLGLVELGIGALRVLQREFHGQVTFVPYLITVGGMVIVVGLLALGMSKRKS